LKSLDTFSEKNISIIIPVLNEATSIVHFLKSLQQFRKRGHEIILVDGGSTDNTLELSKHYIDQSLSSVTGRAAQMNLGAQQAKNTILLFLHSDTFLPEFADSIIIKSITKKTPWGRFNVKLSGHQFIFRIIETMINFRSKYTNIATGDQAIFISKEIFNKINYFPDIALMEDIAISKKLKKHYACTCLTETVTTSSRRWEQHGITRTLFLMWMLRFLYFIKIKPKILCQYYYNKKNTCCLIFTKNPELGKTKTRLIPALGIKGAYDVHIKLLKHTLNLTNNTMEMNFQLFHTSSNTNKVLKELVKKHNLEKKTQHGNNLGERMFNAFNLSLKTYSHCIIIGTDCPELTQHYLLQAKHHLRNGYDAVIGPAYDGGYVLIGLNVPDKLIFKNINWGENTVFKDTITAFEKLNLKYKKLTMLHDIDTKEDLQYLDL